MDRIPAGSRRAVAVAHRTPRVAAQGPGRTRPRSAGAVRLAGCFLATGRGRLPMPPWCFRGGLLFPDPGPDWLGAAGCGRRRQQEREPSGRGAGGDGAAHARSEGRRQFRSGAAEEVAVLGWRLLPAAAGDGFRRVIGCGARMVVINRAGGAPQIVGGNAGRAGNRLPRLAGSGD